MEMSGDRPVCEVCGKPATYGFSENRDGQPGKMHYCCDEHGPEDIGVEAHCRDCYETVSG